MGLSRFWLNTTGSYMFGRINGVWSGCRAVSEQEPQLSICYSPIEVSFVCTACKTPVQLTRRDQSIQTGTFCKTCRAMYWIGASVGILAMSVPRYGSSMRCRRIFSQRRPPWSSHCVCLINHNQNASDANSVLCLHKPRLPCNWSTKVGCISVC